MADTLTGTSATNNLLSNYFVPAALETLYNETPLYEFAEKASQPKGNGNITYWNAWIRLAGASVVLAEGGANSLAALSARRVSATIAQYGRGYKLSDLAMFMDVLDPSTGGRDTLMNSAKETLEYICHMGIYKNSIGKNRIKTTNLSSYMSSVASAFCATTGTHNGDSQFGFPAVFGTSCGRLSAVSGTAPTPSAQLSVFSIRKAVLKLDNNAAMRFADGNFVGYASPGALFTLYKDPTWTMWNVYQNSKDTMYKNEAGSVHSVRFVRSQLAPRYAVAAHSVNMVFIFGRQAFGVTDVFGGLQMFHITGADSNNPFDTFDQLTYKISAAATALNPSAGVILFVAEKTT